MSASKFHSGTQKSCTDRNDIVVLFWCRNPWRKCRRQIISLKPQAFSAEILTTSKARRECSYLHAINFQLVLQRYKKNHKKQTKHKRDRKRLFAQNGTEKIVYTLMIYPV